MVSFKFANEHFLNCFISYSLRIRIKNRQRRDFPSGRWLRIFLPMQWTWVPGPGTQIPHALGPINCNYGAHLVHLPKPVCSRASALQKDKPAKPEAWPLQLRVALTHHNKRRPTQQGRARVCQRRSSRVKDK